VLREQLDVFSRQIIADILDARTEYAVQKCFVADRPGLHTGGYGGIPHCRHRRLRQVNVREAHDARESVSHLVTSTRAHSIYTGYIPGSGRCEGAGSVVPESRLDADHVGIDLLHLVPDGHRSSRVVSSLVTAAA